MLVKHYQLPVDTNTTCSLSVKFTNRSPNEQCLIEFDRMSYYLSITSAEELIKFGQTMIEFGNNILDTRSVPHDEVVSIVLGNDPIHW